jgi:hypothetical protein
MGCRQVMLLHAFPEHISASLLLHRLRELSCAAQDRVCAAAKVRLEYSTHFVDGHRKHLQSYPSAGYGPIAIGPTLWGRAD